MQCTRRAIRDRRAPLRSVPGTTTGTSRTSAGRPLRHMPRSPRAPDLHAVACASEVPTLRRGQRDNPCSRHTWSPHRASRDRPPGVSERPCSASSPLRHGRGELRGSVAPWLRGSVAPWLRGSVAPWLRGSGLRAPGSGLRAPGSGLRAPGSGLREPDGGGRADRRGAGSRAPRVQAARREVRGGEPSEDFHYGRGGTRGPGKCSG